MELQNALALVDKERDQLVEEANRRDEGIAMLKKELHLKEMGLMESQQAMGQLESQLGQAEGTYRNKDQAMNEVTQELNRTRLELVNAKELADSLNAQVAKLRADLHTMAQVLMRSCMGVSIVCGAQMLVSGCHSYRPDDVDI